MANEEKKVKPNDDKKAFAGKKLADAGIYRLGEEFTGHSIAVDKLIADGKAFSSEADAKASGEVKPADSKPAAGTGTKPQA